MKSSNQLQPAFRQPANPKKGNPKSGLGWSVSGLALVCLLYVAFFCLRGRIDLTAVWPRAVFYVVGGLACICFGMGVGHSIKVLRNHRRR